MRVERMLSQFRDIATGVARKINPDKRYSLLYALRKAECNWCEHKVTSGLASKCNLCGCFIPLKVRAVTETNDCPMGKWIRKEYFGNSKYENVIVRGHNDVNTAISDCTSLYFLLKKKVRKLCTRAQYKSAVYVCRHAGKHLFEQRLCEFMIESESINKSKYRQKNQYELEITLREFNIVIKALVALTQFKEENSNYVEKKR